MKINKVYVNFGLVILGLALVYFMAVVVVPNVLVTLTKAAPASSVSIPDSYFIGGKLLAVADGKDSVVVNVFALDNSGKGVPNKVVEVSGFSSEIPTQVTGSDGKAEFKLTSKVIGQFKLEANIDGAAVGKSVTVTFRN